MAVNEIIEGKIERKRLSSPMRPRYFWAKPGLSEWTDGMGVSSNYRLCFFIAQKSPLGSWLYVSSSRNLSKVRRRGGVRDIGLLQNSICGFGPCEKLVRNPFGQASARPSITAHKQHYAKVHRCAPDVKLAHGVRIFLATLKSKT